MLMLLEEHADGAFQTDPLPAPPTWRFNLLGGMLAWMEDHRLRQSGMAG